MEAGFIEEHNIDDNQENDYDTYLIRKDTGGNDNKFINNTAFYISSIAKYDDLNGERNMILDLIADYKKTRDVNPISELVNKMTVL